METREYRLTRTVQGHPANSPVWLVHVTHGLLDVELIGQVSTQQEARIVAKTHAAKRNVKPIILT